MISQDDDVTQNADPKFQNWMARLSKRRRIVIALMLALTLFAIYRVFFQVRPKIDYTMDSASRQPVAVARVLRGSLPIIFTELGTVVPVTNVTVQSRVSGYIMDVKFEEGQHVKKDAELALIDPRPYQIALEQARGTLQQDAAQLADARVNSGRYETLIRQKSVAAMTAKDAQYKVQQLEGTVKLDQANVDNARLNLYYCHIRAPVDGRIGIRAVDKGNYFTAGQTNGLATLTQMQPISVIFTVPQSQLSAVTQAINTQGSLPVEAWDSGNNNKIADGVVKSVDSQIDTATGTVRMRAIFPNTDEKLFPNAFVNAHLRVDTLENVLLLPGDAIQTGPDGPYVYLTTPKKTVTLRTVKTGAASATKVEILEGLQAGDRVVVQGTNHLREGAKILIEADDDAKKNNPAQGAPIDNGAPSPQ